MWAPTARRRTSPDVRLRRTAVRDGSLARASVTPEAHGGGPCGRLVQHHQTGRVPRQYVRVRRLPLRVSTGGLSNRRGLRRYAASAPVLVLRSSLVAHESYWTGYGGAWVGLDNDCDGLVDETFPEANTICATGLLGRCAAGTIRCVNGSLACVQNLAAITERCLNGAFVASVVHDCCRCCCCRCCRCYRR